MPPKSTAARRITVPKSTAQLFLAASVILENRRMVKHTMNDVITVAMDAVMKSSRDQVRLLSRFYVDADSEYRTLKVSRELKQAIVNQANKLNVTKPALLYAIGTIFVRAALAAFWKSHKKGYYELISELPEFRIAREQKSLDLPEAKIPQMKTRPLYRKQDQTAMRHYNYMQEFKSYMENFGGIDSFVNRNLIVNIYAHPLEGNVNRTVEGDKPASHNPSNIHTVKIWKRGRGYNLTILGHNEAALGAPELTLGATFRLYDIYRNIDWTTLKDKELV